jgi:hypothetical protein
MIWFICVHTMSLWTAICFLLLCIDKEYVELFTRFVAYSDYLLAMHLCVTNKPSPRRLRSGKEQTVQIPTAQTASRKNVATAVNQKLRPRTGAEEKHLEGDKCIERDSPDSSGSLQVVHDLPVAAGKGVHPVCLYVHFASNST